MTKLYYYLYRVTNLINQKIYAGCHATDNLDDGYMGSGKLIKYAYKKYGLDNFKKDILSFHSSYEEMLLAESQMINPEFLNRPDVYNLAIGGKGGYKGKACYESPERSAKISAINKGLVSCKDQNGSIIRVKKEEFLTKELVGTTHGLATVRDTEGNIFKVPLDDPRLISGKLVGVTKGKVLAKDSLGNKLQVDQNDPRLLSGELVGHTKGQKQTVESNEKRRQTQLGMSKPQPKFACAVCGKMTSRTNLIRWHKSCTKNDK
jgi:hypothetical protein